MAYDGTKPANGSALVSADIRENFRALKDDGIVTPAADSVDPAKCYAGTLNPVQDASTYSTNNTSWKTVKEFRFLCPTNPTSMRVYLEVKNDNNNYKAYGRAVIAGIGSSGPYRENDDWGWMDCGSVDLSGLTPGTVYTIAIQIQTNHSSYNASIRGTSIWWE